MWCAYRNAEHFWGDGKMPEDLGKQWDVHYKEWTNSDPGNTRCSLGIFTRKERRLGKTVKAGDGDTNPRPMLGVEIGDGNGGEMWVYTMHATSGGGGPTQAYVESALIVATHTTGNFVVAGDFNIDPTTAQNICTNTLPGHNIKIAAQKERTQQSGGNLDYFALKGVEVEGKVLRGTWDSDHYPVIVEVRPCASTTTSSSSGSGSSSSSSAAAAAAAAT